jgi:predicted AlkP superfamily phosphohydrolase/phosphomutase
VIGFDGMDHELTERLLSQGRLPAFARLRAAGGFSALGTSIPPQSPVAWSEFITGMDAGGHGIFDFLHRDPATMTPYLSTSLTEAATRTLDLGPWRIPLSGGEVRLLRRGTPFWEILEERGVTTTIVRIPANFPPSGTASRELSGMGTPDILGGYGTFTLVTTAPDEAPQDLGGGGVMAPAARHDGAVTAVLRGPPHPFRVDGRALELPLTVYVDRDRPVARVDIGEERAVLMAGDWSDWMPVEFELGPLLGSLRGTCRVLLQRTHPELVMYVTPIQLDPLDPTLPIATPPGFAGELASTGRYYTQGMPEDTKALTAGVLSAQEFLEQAGFAREEAVRQYRPLLDDFARSGDDRLLFYYFGFMDQASHVFWHATDPQHPAHDPVRDAPYAGVIEDLYVAADSIVAETLEAVGEDVLVIVMSDHGFTSWRRAFSLNAWLEEAGYLAVKDDHPSRREEMDFLTNVDWSRTQAYGLGLSGLYVNLRGREATGIVPENQREIIVDEIARRLTRVTDPATGEPVIARVLHREEYDHQGALDIAPDLVVEYARGVRASDASAGGKVPSEVLSDNTSLWSGDHIMDHRAVPGVLFTNRPLEFPAHTLRELAAAVLAQYGAAFPPAPTVHEVRKE